MTTISGHPNNLADLERLVADARRLGAVDVASVEAEADGRVCITFAADEGDTVQHASNEHRRAVADNPQA